ncbi:APC family permease [Tepidibacter aestuarii]|uniref:APC family permease n=1 Tax=Tepidibacter aestuarii TaxID=2925782 RepID=UPI0020BE63F3|nr:APC family permease [Tepidibacter aestuarii]CAH2212109.1 agmatine/putrescine antiporter AguD [Tepidibacter aestuarii]
MPEKKKKFRLIDAVMASVCIILVAESAAPAASIGNSQFFWWIVMLVGFFIPYGLISSELGTTYDCEGGLYDWVKTAYGNKWASRVAWNYWINFPLWMASLAVLFCDLLVGLTGLQINTGVEILLKLLFIVIVTTLSLFKISESKWIINTAAVFKVLIMLSIGVLGIYTAATKGMATKFTIESMLPSLDLVGLSFISVIIFNFCGAEIITSLAPEMDSPQKQIPQALLLGGIIIAIFYMFSAFGIGVAIPLDELSASSGFLDSIRYLTGGGILVTILGIMFIFTLFANLVSWSYGVNYVVKYAADNNDMPKIFSKTSEKTGIPTNATIFNGIFAGILVIISPFMPSQDIFWSFFGVSAVTLVASYIPMFPAFLKLRRIDPDAERPFKVKGSGIKLKLITYIPMVLLISSLIFTVVPMSTSPEELSTKIPLTIGVIISIILQEIIVFRGVKNRAKAEVAK